WGRHARSFGHALGRYADVALCGSNLWLDSDHRPDGDVAQPFNGASSADAVGIALGSVAFLPYIVGTPRILSTVWETTKVPEPHARLLREVDQLWVPTEWGRQLFMAHGISAASVRVVPEGVDTDLFCPVPAGSHPPGEIYRFLCVGKWEARKGTAELVRAFVEEFHASEPVELIMHCHNVYRSGFDAARAIASERGKFPEPRPRILVSAPCSLTDLIRLMQSSDAFVLPTRAEAWGLPILEAMSCGLPCIVTDYGGHRAFANAANSFLIRVERQVRACDPVHLNPSFDWGEWAEPDLSHLRYLMRYVFDHRQEAAERGRMACADAVRSWTWDNAARQAMSHLSELIGSTG
ncbi:MAG: glycosyltransferase family 4 protein, partial [Acidisphaera sp.]|nr:glycosyltransferase family 4 protein [Acidisphaera sp.]